MRAEADGSDWIPFAPVADAFEETSIDLRFLNEKFAGEHGFIRAESGRFVQGDTGTPIRFWAVNGPPHSEGDSAKLRTIARSLAKRGVNLVRIHGAVFTPEGEPDAKKVHHLIEVVEAMKVEGIYSHASIYFPLWFRPKTDLAWLKGYDGNQHPFAALMFNPEFEAKYRTWWEAVLQTKSSRTGRSLIEEPALMGLEIQNEDSFFFWTFSEQNIPDAQLRILEQEFGKWLAKKYASLDETFVRWKGVKLKRDVLEEGRIAFRPLWNISHERTLRDQDTANFLLETQTQFYSRTYKFLRGLGFRGVVCASNWATASPEVLGPLEKLGYTTCDFVDRHGYFSCFHKGEASEWSIRDGHVYDDRSALRFDATESGKPRVFLHPVMDPKYAAKPSMISETTWTRPNRFRSEAPLYLSVYGSLQDSDAIVHFAHDGADWSVKPNFWMQPWTLMSPAMMGQFPAAALIYRKALVAPGELVAKVVLNEKELQQLKGTPLPQDAALDELRLKDIPDSAELKPGERLDPLLHYVGRTEVIFTNGPSSTALRVSKELIDHTAKRVTSSHRELQLDYGNGVLTINSPKAQGVSGNVRSLGKCDLRDVTIESDLDLAHIVIVPLDDQPIASSRKLLLQVMSEEQNSGWKTENTAEGKKRIVSIGRDPWMIKPLRGTVQFKRSDAELLHATALDPNGKPVAEMGNAAKIILRPENLYYLIH